MTEILAYGPVGSWFGFTAADFALALRGGGDALVRLHSDGGDALEGLAIANVIRAHKGRVTVQVDGLAASAATPMLCTAAEVVLSPGALVMLHEVRALAEGDAQDLRAQAEVCEKITASYCALYAAKTGKDADEMRALVAKNGWAVGSWLTAEEALQLGLADRIGDPVQLAAARPQARVLNSPAARFYLSAGAKGPKMTEAQIALRKRLGLAADATRAQVTAALAEMEKAAAEHEEPDGDEEKEGEEERKEPKAEGAEEPDGDEDPKVLKAALAEALRQRDAARAKLQDAPKAAADREKQIRADVSSWIQEGRIDREDESRYLDMHRKGEAAGIVKHLKAGTTTTGQRLRGGSVGTELNIPTPRTERPAAPPRPLDTFSAQLAAERGIPMERK